MVVDGGGWWMVVVEPLREQQLKQFDLVREYTMNFQLSFFQLSMNNIVQ